MNNWTLQMMQEKNQLIKEQANRITDLKGQLKKCGKERAWAERQLEESVPFVVVCREIRANRVGDLHFCYSCMVTTKQNCPLLNNE